jgi:hypothetical protein
MHLYPSQISQNLGRIFKLEPIELNILSGREMTIATIVLIGNFGKHPHLLAIE